jgi:hypothetical protein
VEREFAARRAVPAQPERKEQPAAPVAVQPPEVDDRESDAAPPVEAGAAASGRSFLLEVRDVVTKKPVAGARVEVTSMVGDVRSTLTTTETGPGSYRVFVPDGSAGDIPSGQETHPASRR